MNEPEPSPRLLRLLRALHTSSYRAIPSQVGLKTVNLASEAELIERDGGLYRPRCRLTPTGEAYRQKHTFTRGKTVALS